MDRMQKRTWGLVCARLAAAVGIVFLIALLHVGASNLLISWSNYDVQSIH